MAANNAPPNRLLAGLRFSTDDLPPGERAAAWRELYGRSVLRLEIEPLSAAPFSAELTVHRLPGLDIVQNTSSPFRVSRTRELLRDGDDGLILQLTNVEGHAVQLGRDVLTAADDAVLLSNSDIGSFTFPAVSTVTALRLRRTALAPLLRDFDSALVQPVPRHNIALRLLTRYLDILRSFRTLETPDLQQLASAHVYDLVAMALGASAEAAEIARNRGVRFARMQAIKADISENLHRCELTLGELASRYRITSRSVQMLFAAEGTTFTAFLLEQRLIRAFRLLTGPLSARRQIQAIAYDSGFNDLSYFNRTFRRRFGMTPSEARASRL